MQPRTTAYAFLHWLNLLFLVAVGYSAVHTGQGEIAGAGLVLEALWLFVGARLTFFQRYAALRNGQIAQKMQALRSLESQQQLAYEYKQRYRDLEKIKAQLLAAAKANERLALAAIEPEMAKMDELLAAFIRIAVAHKKVTQYLAQTTRASLEAELQNASGASRDLSERRLAEHDKIAQTERTLADQLGLIEKTFAYLKTKIISMERPTDLGEELDTLVRGVEAAERTLAATDAIDEELRKLERRVSTGA